MKLRILPLTLILAGVALAQRPKPNMDDPTPESRLLREIDRTQRRDRQKKYSLRAICIRILKHEADGWVYEQMQPAYLKAGQPDKTLEIGSKVARAGDEAGRSPRRRTRTCWRPRRKTIRT